MSYKGKINVYVCPQGHQTITIDKDEGTTPFKLGCRTPNCGQLATSQFYQVDQSLMPEYEWYKPTDIKKVAKNLKEHVRMGGLIIRKIQTKQ